MEVEVEEQESEEAAFVVDCVTWGVERAAVVVFSICDLHLVWVVVLSSGEGRVALEGYGAC